MQVDYYSFDFLVVSVNSVRFRLINELSNRLSDQRRKKEPEILFYLDAQWKR